MRFLGTTRWTCWSATLRRVPLLALALLPAACATHWFRPATSDVEFEQDNQACQHMNSLTVSISPTLMQTYVSPIGYKRCMEAEGYAPGGPWEGQRGMATRMINALTEGPAGQQEAPGSFETSTRRTQ